MRVGSSTICRSVTYLAVILATPQGAFAWGREGHQIIVIVAEHYIRPEAAARMRELLAPESPEEASVWADEYRHGHRETGPWHYIDIPLADSKIDLARECPNGDCVVAKTEQFLAVLKDPNADKDAKAQALRFVIHFVGDLHQPLHDEDNGDKGGNMRHVIFAYSRTLDRSFSPLNPESPLTPCSLRCGASHSTSLAPLCFRFNLAIEHLSVPHPRE